MNTPSPLLPPPGASYLSDWYIPRPFEEQAAAQCLQFRHPIVLWGIQGIGRTWFQNHVASTWQQKNPGQYLATLGFHAFLPEHLASFEGCLLEIARILSDTLFPASSDQEPISQVWSRIRGTPAHRFSKLLERTVLPRLTGDLLLIFEDADVLLPHPYYQSLAGMLRSWADNANPPWNRLHLMVTVSTHLARLTTERNQSPFANLANPLFLGDLKEEQVRAMASRYGLDVNNQGITDLINHVGGHPRLLAAVFNDLKTRQYALRKLVEGEALGSSYILQELSHARDRLKTSPGLAQAFEQIARDPSAPLDEYLRDQLIRWGLLTQTTDGHHPMARRLFRRLLR